MLRLVLLYTLLSTGCFPGFTIQDDVKARGKIGSNQEVLGNGIDGEKYQTACPDYKHYAVMPQYVQAPSVAPVEETTDDSTVDL